MLTAEQIQLGAKSNADKDIIRNVVGGMSSYAAEFGLNQPHREIHLVSQLAHESGHFRTTTEYADGSAYENRLDLGNVYKGDGRRFRGRGVIQLTGRANHRAFTRWMRNRAPGCPDFEAEPHLVAEFPWAFLAAIYYWQDRALNRYADQNDIEMITRRINGGLNGYSERLGYYVRFGLIRLGFEPDEVHQFQSSADIKVDNVAGPQTRRAIHDELVQLELPKSIPPLPIPELEIPPPPDIDPSGPPKKQTIWIFIAALLRRLFRRS